MSKKVNNNINNLDTQANKMGGKANNNPDAQVIAGEQNKIGEYNNKADGKNTGIKASPSTTNNIVDEIKNMTTCGTNKLSKIDEINNKIDDKQVSIRPDINIDNNIDNENANASNDNNRTTN